jgi:hypothetical protein
VVNAPEDGSHEPEPDDEDTGPLAWDEPRRASFAPRFEEPLTVHPRQVQRHANPRILLGVAAVVAVVAIGVVAWFLWPSSDTAPATAPTTSAPPPAPGPTEDEERLLAMLPKGYPEDACDPVDAPKEALAQVSCEKNTDQDGPQSATYTLAKDRAGLDAVFKATTGTAQRVNCPGNIQSPGPWRRNATPQKISGTLFCGVQEGLPTVAWTDDDKLVVSVVHAGPSGPTFPALYAWWSAHS